MRRPRRKPSGCSTINRSKVVRWLLTKLAPEKPVAAHGRRSRAVEAVSDHQPVPCSAVRHRLAGLLHRVLLRRPVRPCPISAPILAPTELEPSVLASLVPTPSLHA